jgi:hypothetical protein
MLFASLASVVIATCYDGDTCRTTVDAFGVGDAAQRD